MHVEMLFCLLLADGVCALGTWWWSSCVVCQEWCGQLPQGRPSCGAGSGGRGPHTLSQTGPGHLVLEEERGEYKESRTTLTYSAHYQSSLTLWCCIYKSQLKQLAKFTHGLESANYTNWSLTCFEHVEWQSSTVMTLCSEKCLSTFFWLDGLLRVRETQTRQVGSGA